MIALLETRAGRLAQRMVGAALLAVLALGIGRLMPTQPGYGIAAALLVLALGIAAVEPVAVPLMALPLLLIPYRVGSGGYDLSISDAVLIGASLAAVVFTKRPFSPALRTLIWLSVIYQFATLFTVVANPYLANAVEWVHAGMLVSGALVVGWTIGRSGYARMGLSLLLAGTLVLAGVTIAQGLIQYSRGDFSAVYVAWPFGMHKNFVGTVLGFGAITAYARPEWMGWSRRWGLGAFWLMAAGVLVTQSRQSILGLGAALLVVGLRGDSVRRRSKAIVLLVVPVLVLVGTLVKDQVESGNQHNSVLQRLTWFEDTLEFWSSSPWVGHGLRYWEVETAALKFQPPNAELEVLASAGVVGLSAFLLLMVGTLVVLWRVDSIYGTLAVAVVLSRVVQGQLDLFWIAVQVSVPFVIVGVCLGAEAIERETRVLLAMESQSRSAVVIS